MEWLRKCKDSYHLTNQVFAWEMSKNERYHTGLSYMHWYKSQDCFVDRETNYVMDSQKGRKRLGYSLIISQLFTKRNTLLNSTTFRRRRPPKMRCISDVIESYRVHRHRVGGSSISSGHSFFSTVYLDITPYVPDVLIVQLIRNA